MNDELPETPVPPDCDLRGMLFMPLDVQRLLDSDLFITATGDEFKAAVALWCKSWSQVPAASLPDDDRVLADYSRSGAKWKRVREVALSGWKKCKDGRLYHPVVAEKAREAWAARCAQRARTEAARLARANCRNQPAHNVTSSVTETVTTSVTDNVTGSKGQGQLRDSKGTGTVLRESGESPPPPGVLTQNQEDTATTTATARKQVSPGKKSRIRKDLVVAALQADDLTGLLTAFGVTQRPGEWERETEGINLPHVATLLHWCSSTGRPIREPSGFRKARAEFQEFSTESKVHLRDQFTEWSQIEIVKPNGVTIGHLATSQKDA